MKNLIDCLWDYSNHNNSSNYSSEHKRAFSNHTLSDRHLKKFLFSTNDETRLYHASKYSNQILLTIDSDEMDFLRVGVLRKEVSGEVSYDKQRDHSAHTLYNYLFGCYLFENSQFIENAFSDYNVDIDFNRFVNLWPFASILHDIGYLFEGSIEPLSTKIQNAQVRNGCDVVNDFFEHNFWIRCEINSTKDRSRLLEIAQLELPLIKNTSLSSVADSLRYIGKLNSLKSILYSKGIDLELPSDAFELWTQYFKFYELDNMVTRIQNLEDYFESLMNIGMTKSGLRMLDHGVCSGLLLLKYNTFYYSLHHALKLAYPNLSTNDKKLCDNFFNRQSITTSKKSRVERTNLDYIIYPAEGWWEHWVRLTAAAAIHNYQQMIGNLPENNQIKLTINEEPFSYLGILVDILQEWDRFNTTPSSIFTEQLPIQGVDILINKRKDGIIEILYPQEKIVKKIKNVLDDTLVDWHKIIDVKHNRTFQ